MLPYVIAKNGEQALGYGIVLVGRAENLHIAAALARQPHPAAAELLYAGIVEFGLKILEAAESLLDRVGDGATGVTAPFGLHDFPEHRVVDMTATVVTHGATDVLRHGIEVANQIFGTLGLEVGMLFESSVEILHIRTMMHVVMQLHRRGIDGGFKSGIVIG